MASILRFALCAALLTSLFGSGLARQAEMQKASEEAKQVMQAEIAECERLYPNKTQRPVTPRVRCLTDAGMRYAQAGVNFGNKNIDLDRLMRAKLLVVAEEYDAGKMTEAQFDLQKAQVVAEHNSAVAQRQNSAAMVDAARLQAIAAMDANSPKTCAGYGNTVTCF